MKVIRRQLGCREPTEKEIVAADRKMRELATVCLSYNCTLVQDAAEAAEAWKTLAEVFQDSGLTRKIGLLRKLTSIRLVNNYSIIADYVNFS